MVWPHLLLPLLILALQPLPSSAQVSAPREPGDRPPAAAATAPGSPAAEVRLPDQHQLVATIKGVVGRSVHGVPRATTVFAKTRSFRAHATNATVCALPRSTRRR